MILSTLLSKQLSGKVAIITGSAIGIGAAIAQAFHREGAKVLITGLPEARGRALARRLGRRAVFAAGEASG